MSNRGNYELSRNPHSLPPRDILMPAGTIEELMQKYQEKIDLVEKKYNYLVEKFEDKIAELECQIDILESNNSELGDQTVLLRKINKKLENDIDNRYKKMFSREFKLAETFEKIIKDFKFIINKNGK